MADRASLVKELFSAPLTYVLTLVLIGVSLVGAFVLKTIPAFVGYTGVGTGILAFIAFLSQDLTTEQVPSGWPGWTTFVAIMVVGGLEALYGQLTSQTFVTLAGEIGALLFLVQFFINYLNQDNGANIPASTEMQWVFLLGVLVTILTSIQNGNLQTTNAETGLAVTAVATFTGHIFAKEQAAKARRAWRAAHPA